MLKSVYKITFYIAIFYIAFCTEFVVNIGRLIASRGYFIPEESSIFTFSVTMDNTGNGEYWLYGEDKKFYYCALTSPYLIISKDNDCMNFDKTDYTTWCESYIERYDLFQK